jgi:hypothetical protein
VAENESAHRRLGVPTEDREHPREKGEEGCAAGEETGRWGLSGLQEETGGEKERRA